VLLALCLQVGYDELSGLGRLGVAPSIPTCAEPSCSQGRPLAKVHAAEIATQAAESVREDSDFEFKQQLSSRTMTRSERAGKGHVA